MLSYSGLMCLVVTQYELISSYICIAEGFKLSSEFWCMNEFIQNFLLFQRLDFYQLHGIPSISFNLSFNIFILWIYLVIYLFTPYA